MYHVNILVYHVNILVYHVNILVYHVNILVYHVNILVYHVNILVYHNINYIVPQWRSHAGAHWGTCPSNYRPCPTGAALIVALLIANRA